MKLKLPAFAYYCSLLSLFLSFFFLCLFLSVLSVVSSFSLSVCLCVSAVLSFLLLSFFSVFLFVLFMSSIYILTCTSTGNMILLAYHSGYNAGFAETVFVVCSAVVIEVSGLLSISPDSRVQGPSRGSTHCSTLVPNPR